MGDGFGTLKIVPDHFQVPILSEDTQETSTSSSPQSSVDHSNGSCSSVLSGRKSGRKLRNAASMLRLFSLWGLTWGSDDDGQKKVELTVAELESLRSELAELEEREAHLKAQLEQVDEMLRSACYSGYLYIRTRWTALPGEPPPIDDTDVDDWLPRFVVLHGPCIFFYLLCTDLSPQDSTLLSDIVEVGSLPSFTREDDETRYCFSILTHHGLRYECSSSSKIQVDSWLAALQNECKSSMDTKAPNGLSDT